MQVRQGPPFQMSRDTFLLAASLLNEVSRESSRLPIAHQQRSNAVGRGEVPYYPGPIS